MLDGSIPQLVVTRPEVAGGKEPVTICSMRLAAALTADWLVARPPTMRRSTSYPEVCGFVGCGVGRIVGRLVGQGVGGFVGRFVGLGVGGSVGEGVVAIVGTAVGFGLGLLEGDEDGFNVG